MPLGSNKPPERVDVRLICATHRDLDEMVRTGKFRDDLYFRVRVITGSLRVAPVVAAAAAASASPGKKSTLRAMREIWLGQAERVYLSELLEASKGNVREAARRAGVTPVTFYRLMARRGVKVVRGPGLA